MFTISGDCEVDRSIVSGEVEVKKNKQKKNSSKGDPWVVQSFRILQGVQGTEYSVCTKHLSFQTFTAS